MQIPLLKTIWKKKSSKKPLAKDQNLQSFLERDFNNKIELNSKYTPVIQTIMISSGECKLKFHIKNRNQIILNIILSQASAIKLTVKHFSIILSVWSPISPTRQPHVNTTLSKWYQNMMTIPIILEKIISSWIRILWKSHKSAWKGKFQETKWLERS